MAGRGVKCELFDLEADISEKRNLADSRGGLAAELERELQDWRMRIGAQMPTLATHRQE